MSNQQWSPWIEWEGGECPVHTDTGVQWKGRGINQNGTAVSVTAGLLYWNHMRKAGDIVAYRYRLPKESPGISDPEEEEALQEAFERMSGESIAAESKLEATEKWEQDQHNYRKLQSLCIEQAHELNKLRRQVRRINQIAKE